VLVRTGDFLNGKFFTVEACARTAGVAAAYVTLARLSARIS